MRSPLTMRRKVDRPRARCQVPRLREGVSLSAQQEFKDRLKKALGWDGRSYAAIASKLGTHAPRISEWIRDEGEDGSTMPSYPYLAKLPDVLGVSGHWLLTGAGDPHGPVPEGSDTQEKVLRGWQLIGQALEEWGDEAPSLPGPGPSVPAEEKDVEPFETLEPKPLGPDGEPREKDGEGSPKKKKGRA